MLLFGQMESFGKKKNRFNCFSFLFETSVHSLKVETANHDFAVEGVARAWFSRAVGSVPGSGSNFCFGSRVYFVAHSW